ncbi:endospore germination permease [Paenibacillus sp. GD4]|uniref:GerAB/ArcD/ProY family transporter n=1 Tax=Paenibacillus sp. GD4 TaxID=3068890 RepID=UPI002796BB40|nr:endospore germination permease [Paenibacillus sp. GD4]MDQ1914820.1 endospore germination permease [Paenibacillus sp. GD4]
MQSQQTISVRQFIILITFCTVGDSILVLPSIPALHAREDAWISGLIGLMMGLLFIYFFAVFGKLYPGLTIFEYNRKLFGKWIGRFATLLLIYYFFLMVSSQVREIGDFMTTQIMPETPIQSIMLLFLLTLVVGARLGIETIARAGEIFIPHFFLLFSILAVCLVPEAEFRNIFPILDNGIAPVLRGALTTTTFPFAENVIMLVILPSVKQSKPLARNILIGVLIGGIILELVIVLTIVVLGAPITAYQMYPSYALAKKISIGNFLERIEAMLAIMWIMSTFFKAVLYFYALMLGLSDLTKLKEPKTLALPLGMILLVSSIAAFPNVSYFNDLIDNYWPYFDFTFCLGLPLLLLAVRFVRIRSGSLR